MPTKKTSSSGNRMDASSGRPSSTKTHSDSNRSSDKSRGHSTKGSSSRSSR
jgi:hypothetical protein